MATSGSNTTWSGGHYVKVTWQETSQSTTENRSAVTVRLYVGSKSGYSISDSSNSYSLVINGTTYSGSNANISHGSGGEDLVMTQSVLIYHNSDGTKSFSMRGSVSGLYFGGITGSTFSGTLDTIARASTFAGASTTDLTAGADKTVTINRQNSNFYHQVRIYLTKSGVSDYLLRTESYNASTTSKTIQWTNSEISDFWRNGHGYYTGTKFILDTYSGGSVIFTTTQTGSLTYPSNNTIGSLAGNFDAGDSVGVTLSKASTLYSHEAELRAPDGTVLATRAVTSASSFSMTADETLLYQKAPNSSTLSVDLYIRTVLTADTSRQVFSWTKEDTVTARLNGAPPTLGSFSYADVNATTTGLTLNNQLIVTGKSTPRFTIGTATAASGASIVDYTVSVSGQTKSRTTAGTLDFSPLSAQGNTTATLTVRDSRGLTASTSVLVQVLSHMNPTLNVTVSRVNGFEDANTLKVNGTFSSVSGKNNVANASAIQYRYRLLPSGTFNAWADITKTTTGTVFTASTVNNTLPNTNSYQFEVKVTDAFGGTTTVQRTLGAGKPIMHIDTVKNAVGVNMFPTISNGFQVEGVSDFKGNVVFNAGLTVSGGSTIFNNGMNVSGSSTFNNNLTAAAALNASTGVNLGGSYQNTDGNLYFNGTNLRLRTGGSFVSVVQEGRAYDNGAFTIEGSLVHNSGYMHMKPYSSGGAHSGAYKYGQIHFSGASNTNEFVFNSRTTADVLSATKVRAGTFVGTLDNSSSIEYKEFVETYNEDALSKINGSLIRTYNYKGMDMADRRVGVIIEDGVPEEIVTASGKGVDPYGMTAMAWKAIQQLTTENAAQQQSIDALEAMVMDLTARIEALEQ